MSILCGNYQCQPSEPSCPAYVSFVSRDIDGFAPSTDSAAPSTYLSMAQQSVDGAVLSVDNYGNDSAQ